MTLRATRWLAVAFALCVATVASADGVASYRADAARIIAAARANHAAWDRLAELTDTFGPRLAGSPALEAALRWAADRMHADGLENVRLEPVRVPRWVRGEESAEIVEPFPARLVMVGLGRSVGTPPEGIEAEVRVVSSWAALDADPEAARGRIVLFNVPFEDYMTTVDYREHGATRAARLGAVGVLLRSVGLPGLRTAHTGALTYGEDVPRIPAAALSVEDANRLQRIHDRGQRLVVRLRMAAHTLPDTDSANLVGEIVGRERPGEVVVLGGHIDSWDVGTGAMDDGGGCVVSWEALRILKSLDLRPRRTLRVVLWTNEENGRRGGDAYAALHAKELDRHVAAIELDSGAFRPLGIAFDGTPAAHAVVSAIAGLLEPIGASEVSPGNVGTDIEPLFKDAGVPALALAVDNSEYFRFHHTAADTVERLDPDDMARDVAATAVLAFVLADLPQPLPR